MNTPRWPDVPVVTAAHAATLLDTVDMNIYRALDRGELQGYRSGGTRLVYTASLRVWPGPHSEGRQPRRSINKRRLSIGAPKTHQSPRL
jgi:hypothetical protein